MVFDRNNKNNQSLLQHGVFGIIFRQTTLIPHKFYMPYSESEVEKSVSLSHLTEAESLLEADVRG